MRVFILCTGRTGSSAIIKACKHIENYSSSHESLSRVLGKERFAFRDNHIEADNRLSWNLGQLHNIYQDEAFYVHLVRDRDKVAQSFMKRFYQPRSIIDSFCEGIKMVSPENLNEKEKLQICYDYIDTVNTNIDLFLSTKTKKLNITLENIENDFPVFWEKIGAVGDLDQALKEFKVKHNSSTNRPFSFLSRLRLIFIREWRHLKLTIQSYQ